MGCRVRVGSAGWGSGPARVEQPVGGVGGVGVVVEHAGSARLGGRRLGSSVVGQVGGVGAEQVVQGVPAGRVLGEQVGAGQLGQQPPDLGRGAAGEAGRRGGAQMSGPGCRPSSRNSRAAGACSAPCTTRRTPPGSCPAGSPASNASSRGCRSCSSAARAASGKPVCWARAAAIASASGSRAQAAMICVDRLGLGGDPVGAEPAGQQLVGPRPVDSRSRLERLGAVRGDQAGELVAAGDHDQTAAVRRAAAGAPARRRGRCPARPASACRPAGCGTAPPARPGWREARSGGTPRASRKPRTASAGAIGAPAGSKPRRFTYNCPSGNRSRHPVCPVHRQRRLADPRRAGDRRDHHRRGRVPLPRQQHIQPAQVRGPTGEPGHVRRQLPGHHREPAVRCRERLGARRRPGRLRLPDGQLRIAVEHGQLQPGQLRSRLDAQLVGQHPPRRVERRQRPGHIPRLVPRPDQQRVTALPQRLNGQHLPHLGGHPVMRPERDQRLGPVLHGTQPLLGHRHPPARQHPAHRHVRRRRPAPQPDAGIPPGHRRAGVTGRLRLVRLDGELPEPDQIQVRGAHVNR